MDDFNISELTESKNEWSIRLINILTPLIHEGINSIFKEAFDLCVENDESDKYLMTFQNFLSRVPKWNNDIVDTETKRIVNKSNCNYLEDLITCVHICHLKILTNMRVGKTQKKIDIDIPKINEFVHKVYIDCARKLYTAIFLFERNIAPLELQKNRKHIDSQIKESICNVIRDSIPVENILRSYMDETTDLVQLQVKQEAIDDKKHDKSSQEDGEDKDKTDDNKSGDDKSDNDKDKDKDTGLDKNSQDKEPDNSKFKLNDNIVINTEDNNDNDDNNENDNDNNSEQTKIKSMIKLNNELIKSDQNDLIKSKQDEKPDNNISFNDNDSAIYTNNVQETITAPKDVNTLEKISNERHEQRKQEDAAQDEEDKIQIFDDNISLGISDVHDIGDPIKLDTLPDLEGVELLA
tara:strand:+ start:3077 stop:4300 length:1224 start_codon:yes stop_codon:yes gene_type:complete